MPPRMDSDNPIRIVNGNDDPEDGPSDIAKIARPILWIPIREGRALNDSFHIRPRETSPP